MDTQHLLSSPKETPAFRGHRRQTFWQIQFPLILAGLIVIAVTVFLIVITAGHGNTVDTHWADISLIWLILPVLAGSLIPLALLGGLIFLMAKLLGALPKYGALGHYYAIRVTEIAKLIGDKVTAPVIAVKSRGAAVKSFFEQLRQRFKR